MADGGVVEVGRTSARPGCAIIVACMPKSGSTFVARTLARLTGYVFTPLRSHHAIQELDRTELLKYRGVGTVSQIHLLGSQYAVDCINEQRARLVVLERNILDAIVSYREFLYSDEFLGVLTENGGFDVGQLCWDASFFDLSPTRQHDFLIDMLVPWYVTFHVSWRLIEPQLESPPLWLTYDGFFADPTRGLAEILERCDLPVDGERIASALETAGEDTRRNRGVPGRGVQLLSREQRCRVESIIAHYPRFRDELVVWN